MEHDRVRRHGGRRSGAAGSARLLLLFFAVAVAAIVASAIWIWAARASDKRVANGSEQTTVAQPLEDVYLTSTDGQLFRTVRGQASEFAPAPTSKKAPQRILISLDVARQAVASGNLQVTLPNRVRYPVRFEQQATSPNGDWTFIGRVRTRIGPLAAVITFGRAGVFGVLPTPEGRMLHIVTNHGQTYIQPAGGLLPTGSPIAPQIGDIAIPKASSRAAPAIASATAANVQQDAGAVPPPPTAAGSEAGITVLGIYTTTLVAVRGSAAAVESEFTNLIAIANQAHIDSGSVARLHLVGMRQVDYDPDYVNVNSNALNDMQQNVIPGINLRATRDQFGADLVAMLRPYVAGDPTCGIAYMNGADLTAEYVSAEYGFSVTATESCGPLVLAHEIGHNLGSNHDIDNGDGIYGAYTFSYGYRQDAVPAFATVMAYASGEQSWIGYFSSPDSSSCLGARCGVADRADNVRSINLMAGRIARFRDPPGSISVLDAAPMFEADALHQHLNFQVRLASPAPRGGVRFDIVTRGVTATAGSDYVGKLLADQVIPEGETSYWFQVEVLNDSVVEGDEIVDARLSNVRGASVFDATGRGVIRNDDPRVQIKGRISLPGGAPWSGEAFSISACSEVQAPTRLFDCDTSSIAADGTYSIGALAGSHVTLQLYPPDPYVEQSVDIGIAGSDVTRDVELVRAAFVSGRVRWPAGDKAPAGDLLVTMERPYHETMVTEYQQVRAPDFTYRFKVFPGSRVTLGVENPPSPYVSQLLEIGYVASDTVRDIELRRVPSLAIGHAAIDEDQGSRSPPEIRLMLSTPAPAGGVRFTLATVDGSAMSDNDYMSTSVEIFIPEGFQVAPSVPVQIQGDPWREPDEAFSVTARNLVGAWLPANGVVRIRNDDSLPAPQWVPGDFTYDRVADIVWRNSSSGGVARWDGPNFLERVALDTVSGASWMIAGVGDFDNDSVSDLLWRNTSTGRNTIWPQAYGPARREISSVGDTRWAVVGIGDFNGDKRSDIFWRHEASGSNVIWKSANSATLQQVTAVTNLEWAVAGVGDFDGNGRDDVLWRNRRTGANVIWKSGNYASQRVITAVTNIEWSVAGVGDFDGDREADILWRNGKTGANVIWLSAASSRQRAVAKVANLEWAVAAVVDYNGDGNVDVFWRNRRLGSNSIWLSADIVTQQEVPAVHPDWQMAR